MWSEKKNIAKIRDRQRHLTSLPHYEGILSRFRTELDFCWDVWRDNTGERMRVQQMETLQDVTCLTFVPFVERVL